MKDQAPKFNAEQIAAQESYALSLRNRAQAGLRREDRILDLYGQDVIALSTLYAVNLPDPIKRLIKNMHMSMDAEGFANINTNELCERAKELVVFVIAASKEAQEQMGYKWEG